MRACFINAASKVAEDPREQLLADATTKARIANVTKSLAKSLAKDGIRVNAIAPDAP